MGEDTFTSLMATYQLPFPISPLLSSHARSPEQLPESPCIFRRMSRLPIVATILIVPVFLMHASLPKQLSSPTSAWLRKQAASPSQLPLPIDPEFSLQALKPRLCFILEAKRTICQMRMMTCLGTEEKSRQLLTSSRYQCCHQYCHNKLPGWGQRCHDECTSPFRRCLPKQNEGENENI